MFSQDHISDYIQKQIQIGPQWMSNRIMGSDKVEYKERSIKVRLEKLIDDFLGALPTAERWLIMPGLRGVGKTTVIAQTYMWLKQTKKINQKQLLYISIEECRHLSTNLADLLEAYSLYLGQEWVYLDKPVFIFIDEIHIDKNWPSVIKAIYEKTEMVFFVCTGSSATGLQVQADTHRRARIERLYPLSFTEYQLLDKGIIPQENLKNKLIEATYFSRDGNDVFKKLKKLQASVHDSWSRYDKNSLDKYIYRHTLTYSMRVDEDDFVFYEKLRGTVNRIVLTDLAAQFRPPTIDVIAQLLFLLADASSEPSYRKLNQILKTTDKQLNNIFNALTAGEILIKVPAWGSHFTRSRKPARYQFMSPAIRVSLQTLAANRQINQKRRGQLIEDLAALHYYREFSQKSGRGQLTHYFPPNSSDFKSADFILKIINSQPIAIEFGSGQKDYKQVEATIAHIGCRYGLVFGAGPLAINKKKTAVRVPLDYFYLM